MGRAGRDGLAPDPPERPVLRGQARRHQARLGRPQQGLDPAGRRDPAAVRQRHELDGARPNAAAALLVPAALAQGRRRHDRRRSRHRRHGRALRPVHRGQPGRLLRGRLGVRALDVVPVPGTPADRRPRPMRTRPRASRWRCTTRPPARTCSTARTGTRPRSAQLRHAACTRSRRRTRRGGLPHRSHALRRLERLGDASRSSRPRAASASTSTTTTTPVVDGSKPGFMTGVGPADAVRRPDGTTIDIVPGEHGDHRRVRPGRADDHQRPARQRARAPRATTARSWPTSTPTTPVGGVQRRSSPPPRRVTSR